MTFEGILHQFKQITFFVNYMFICEKLIIYMQNYDNINYVEYQIIQRN